MHRPLVSMTRMHRTELRASNYSRGTPAEDAKHGKCEVGKMQRVRSARAVYSYSIKKFADGNFSCKLAKGARILILHAFASLSIESVDYDVSKRRDKSVAIDAYGWRVTRDWIRRRKRRERTKSSYLVRIWSYRKLVHISYFIQRSVSRYALHTGDKDIVIVPDSRNYKYDLGVWEPSARPTKIDDVCARGLHTCAKIVRRNGYENAQDVSEILHFLP